MYASGRRTAALQQLDVPTLVIHGRDDTLITPSGGFRTAELIPGAHLLFVADMGHDMPEPLWPLFVDTIVGHTRRAG
jgi:pimeloyl-ACP methyl ester carboxylesterase